MFIDKPPMGFNTWNTFGPNINEGTVISLADKMIDSGLFNLGYNYLVIDDCWACKKRSKEGRLVANPEKFPHGMKYIADYVHSKGLKFGMYSCAGTLTCGGYPGSYQHEFTDAETFAEWEVDFLKYDYCFRSERLRGEELYRKMSLALKNTGRDILFSACSWGHDNTYNWIDTTGSNIWRATLDINDSWDSIKKIALSSIENNNKNFINCYSDLDMLVIGMNGKGYSAVSGCTYDEYVTHFSFWAMFASPLIIGCDIRNIDNQTKSILMNKEIIAINQDDECNRPWELGGAYGETKPFVKAFAKILHNGDIALGLFNFTDEQGYRFITSDMLGIDFDSSKEIIATNLWTNQTVIPENNLLGHTLLSHSCAIYRIKIINKEEI